MGVQKMEQQIVEQTRIIQILITKKQFSKVEQMKSRIAKAKKTVEKTKNDIVQKQTVINNKRKLVAKKEILVKQIKKVKKEVKKKVKKAKLFVHIPKGVINLIRIARPISKEAKFKVIQKTIVKKIKKLIWQKKL